MSAPADMGQQPQLRFKDSAEVLEALTALSRELSATRCDGPRDCRCREVVSLCQALEHAVQQQQPPGSESDLEKTAAALSSVAAALFGSPHVNLEALQSVTATFARLVVWPLQQPESDDTSATGTTAVSATKSSGRRSQAAASSSNASSSASSSASKGGSSSSSSDAAVRKKLQVALAVTKSGLLPILKVRLQKDIPSLSMLSADYVPSRPVWLGGSQQPPQPTANSQDPPQAAATFADIHDCTQLCLRWVSALCSIWPSSPLAAATAPLVSTAALAASVLLKDMLHPTRHTDTAAAAEHIAAAVQLAGIVLRDVNRKLGPCRIGQSLGRPSWLGGGASFPAVDLSDTLPVEVQRLLSAEHRDQMLLLCHTVLAVNAALLEGCMAALHRSTQKTNQQTSSSSGDGSSSGSDSGSSRGSGGSSSRSSSVSALQQSEGVLLCRADGIAAESAKEPSLTGRGCAVYAKQLNRHWVTVGFPESALHGVMSALLECLPAVLSRPAKKLEVAASFFGAFLAQITSAGGVLAHLHATSSDTSSSSSSSGASTAISNTTGISTLQKAGEETLSLLLSTASAVVQVSWARSMDAVRHYIEAATSILNSSGAKASTNSPRPSSHCTSSSSVASSSLFQPMGVVVTLLQQLLAVDPVAAADKSSSSSTSSSTTSTRTSDALFMCRRNMELAIKLLSSLFSSVCEAGAGQLTPQLDQLSFAVQVMEAAVRRLAAVSGATPAGTAEHRQGMSGVIASVFTQGMAAMDPDFYDRGAKLMLRKLIKQCSLVINASFAVALPPMQQQQQEVSVSPQAGQLLQSVLSLMLTVSKVQRLAAPAVSAMPPGVMAVDSQPGPQWLDRSLDAVLTDATWGNVAELSPLGDFGAVSRLLQQHVGYVLGLTTGRSGAGPGAVAAGQQRGAKSSSSSQQPDAGQPKDHVQDEPSHGSAAQAAKQAKTTAAARAGGLPIELSAAALHWLGRTLLFLGAELQEECESSVMGSERLCALLRDLRGPVSDHKELLQGATTTTTTSSSSGGVGGGSSNTAGGTDTTSSSSTSSTGTASRTNTKTPELTEFPAVLQHLMTAISAGQEPQQDSAHGLLSSLSDGSSSSSTSAEKSTDCLWQQRGLNSAALQDAGTELSSLFATEAVELRSALNAWLQQQPAWQERDSQLQKDQAALQKRWAEVGARNKERHTNRALWKQEVQPLVAQLQQEQKRVDAEEAALQAALSQRLWLLKAVYGFGRQVPSAGASLCNAAGNNGLLGCSNPLCINLSTVSEGFALVRGKACVCARCHAARYCCPDCQALHWLIHKDVCRSTPAAT